MLIMNMDDTNNKNFDFKTMSLNALNSLSSDDDEYKRIYNNIVDPNKRKKVIAYLKGDEATVSGNGEILIQDIDRFNPNIISLSILGKSEQEQAFNIVPTFDNPIKFIQNQFYGYKLNGFDDFYKDKLFEQNKFEQNLFYDEHFNSDYWQLDNDMSNSEMLVFKLYDMTNNDYLDHDLDFEFIEHDHGLDIPNENSKVVCSHLENIDDDTKEGIWVDENRNICIRIKKERLSSYSYDGNGLKKFINSLGYFQLTYLLKFQRNINDILFLMQGDNVNILFSDNVSIDNENFMVNRESKEYTSQELEINVEYQTLPIQL